MWYLSHSILARALDLKLAVSKGRGTLGSSPESSFCPVYSSGWLSQDALGSTPVLPVCMLSLFLSVVFALVFYFLEFWWLLPRPGQETRLFCSSSSSGANVPKTADTVLDRHRCNVSGYRGDIVYRSFPPGRGCLRFV